MSVFFSLQMWRLWKSGSRDQYRGYDPERVLLFDFLKGEVLPKCDSTRRRRIAKKIVNVLFTNMKCSFIGGLFSTADHGSSRGIFKESV